MTLTNQQASPTYSPSRLIRDASAVLVDLDGCLLAGRSAAPGAHELLRLAGERLVVVSNNSTDTAASMAGLLADLGLPVPAERIVLAGEVALRLLREQHPGAPVLAMVGGPLAATLDDLALVETDPEVVLLCRDLYLSYVRLRAAARALHGGAALIVANPDLSHPDADGAPVPETGSLLAALRAMVPGITPTVVGKPESGLYREALARLGASPETALMMGDNPDTDLVGARRLGMAGLLVEPATADGGGLPALLAATPPGVASS